MNKPLGSLPDGTPVFDRADSHLDGHPEVKPFLREAFAQVEVPERLWAGVIELGRTVGTSSCLEVTAGEPVLYGWRHGRRGCSRFVKGRSPIPCSTIKLVLARDSGIAVLVTAFIGGDVPPEPWASGAATSEAAHRVSVAFWERHALLWDPSLVDESLGLRDEAPDFWVRSRED